MLKVERRSHSPAFSGTGLSAFNLQLSTGARLARRLREWHSLNLSVPHNLIEELPRVSETGVADLQDGYAGTVLDLRETDLSKHDDIDALSEPIHLGVNEAIVLVTISGEQRGERGLVDHRLDL